MWNGVWQQNGQNGLGVLLDTTYPYEPSPYDPDAGSPGTYPANNVVYFNGDAPSTGIDQYTTEATLNCSFQTWMMYRPPGAGSLFVPIKNIEWNCAGDGVEDPVLGWYVASSDSGWDYLDDFPDFPTWTDRSRPDRLNEWY